MTIKVGMLALHVTHVLDTMTPYIVVPWHTVVCVCVCAKYIHSTVSIDIYSRIITETM